MLYLLVVAAHLLRHFLDFTYNGTYGLVDTALQVHGIGTGSHVAQTLANDGLSQYGSSRRAVASVVAGLRGHALNQLCTSVLESISQFYFLGHGHAVLRNLGRTELLFYNHVPALRAEGYLHCICQLIDALLHQVAGLEIESNIFCHNLI